MYKLLLLLLLIQYTHLDRTSLKKFVYLMIDAIERQINIKEFNRINDKALEFLDDLLLIKYTKFIQLREFMIKNLRELLENQIDQ